MASRHGSATVAILVLQHADWELPGCYGAVLHDRGAQTLVARPDQDERLPDWREFDAILAMGGPMSVNDDARLPWLRGEKTLITEAVAAGTPYLGVCLGAQLLAAALGAPVYRGPRPEYGMHPVDLSAAARTDPVLGAVPARLDVFQWHGETFDLPAGAIALAGSPGYPHQAIRAGDHAYGLQFHLEVSQELLGTWLAVPDCLAEAQRALGPDAQERLTAQLQAAETEMLGHARHIMTAWLDLITGQAGRAAPTRRAG
jgi:GMP synthase-like glutamine amidotransferase